MSTLEQVFLFFAWFVALMFVAVFLSIKLAACIAFVSVVLAAFTMIVRRIK